jgi:hypothetical protein
MLVSLAGHDDCVKSMDRNRMSDWLALYAFEEKVVTLGYLERGIQIGLQVSQLQFLTDCLSHMK